MTHTKLTQSSFLTRVNEVVKAISNHYRKRLAIKNTISELSRLSDRDLDDIGLNRGDIYFIAHADAHDRRGGLY